MQNYEQHINAQKQLAFKPRKSKNEAPLGWSPTTKRGKPEWRCKDIQYVFKYNEYRRCSYICEKKCIKTHKRHEYKIPQEEDEDFPLEILKSVQRITHREFNKRYIYQLVVLCGKLDISCRKAASNAMRDFTLFLLKEGFELGRNPNTENIYIDKCLDKVSIKQLTDQMIHAAQKEFETSIQKFRGKKFCSLLCDAGTVSKSHCLHFILASLGQPVLKFFFES